MAQQPQPNPVTTTSLLSGAREIAAALAILSAQKEPPPARGPAILAAHCVELGLKAFLLSRGWTETKLQRTLGHDLVRAWREAAGNGLRIPGDPPWWLCTLNSLHVSPYMARYAQTNSGLVTPNHQAMSVHVNGLLELVSTSLLELGD